jgi:HEPN domain-containing protein
LLARKVIDDREVRRELVLFHIQQAVEKAIKAILSYKGEIFPKTHDIEDLIEFLWQRAFNFQTILKGSLSLHPMLWNSDTDFWMKSQKMPLSLAEEFVQFVTDRLKGKG